MYIPKLHEQPDLGILHDLIRAHPLGTWVTQADGELIVNHVPFVLDSSQGTHGTLRCHVARANSVWRSFSKTDQSIVVFQGPDAYISPSWYPSKTLHGKVVPTWNYTAVHVHGIPAIIEDGPRLLRHLIELTNSQEHGRETAWRVSDAPAEFIAQMCEHIVGIEIPIAKILGKWKVSQNRSASDRMGAAAGLRAAGSCSSAQIADWIDTPNATPGHAR